MTKKSRQGKTSKQLLKRPSNSSSVNKKPKSNPLEGSRFRWLNESLYTESGSKSFEVFQKDPNLFRAYHEGFRSQAMSWPVTPVTECCSFIASSLKQGSIVGDFGCGDADIAKTLGQQMKVHSFDLVSTNSLVTACNISSVPLADASLDIAVFSLSLMGTDWPQFVTEAQRCLKVGGLLYIAEVQSRVTDFDSFRKQFLTSFEIVASENSKQRYFVKLILRKKSNKPVELKSDSLKPCLYKRR